MKVRDVMQPSAEVIHCDRTVVDAAKMMEKGSYGGIPIEENDKMIGMITDRDIVLRVVAKGKDPKTTLVKDCMSEGISYCYDDEELESISKKMGTLQHRRLPVVNREKRLVGMLSLSDIARKGNNERLTHETMSHVPH